MINLQLIQPFKCYNAKFSFHPSLQVHSKLNKDTVSFGKKRDLLDLPEDEVFKRIDKSVRPKNFIGQGYEASCYRIPNTDYCVRLMNDNAGEYRNGFSTEVSESDQVNNVVAKLGGGSQIKRYVEGYPVDFPDGVKFDKTLEYVADVIDKMPVSSYCKMLKQISKAAKADMMFDSVALNVIVNPQKKSVTVIDFYDNDNIEPDPLRPLRSMYLSLINSKTTNEQKIRIAGNVLLAALAEYKPHHRTCVKLQELDVDSFLSRIKKENLFEDDESVEFIAHNWQKLDEIKKISLKNPNEGTENLLLSTMNDLRELISQVYLK